MHNVMPKNMNPEHNEGPVAEAIEQQTAKLPSDIFLWGGLGALATAAVSFANGKRHEALLIGQWAAPILILGLYNKLVKLEGSN
jgi:uroporphyrinogen-III decarboxylase